MNIVESFKKLYGENEEQIRVFFSPGRVNLIGEHTDYNGGYVLPCALDFGTYAVVRKRNDKKAFFASLNFDLKVETDLTNIEYKKEDDWVNYPKGVLKTIQDRGFDFSGFEVLFYGNIPNGAGLSSSASLELAMSVIINALYNLNIEMIELVKVSQIAENTFAGVNCGIMDQFAVGMGKTNSAMFLKCDTLQYDYVPLELNGYKIVISNTNKRRGLADSKYNERRSECEKALEILQTVLNVKDLGEVSLENFEKHKHLLKDEILIKRTKHVITEDNRVLDAVEALKSNDIKKFGELMIGSHNSLRDDYEVTGIELDTLVEEALKYDFVIGSRMTGAGFGGCTVSIVKEENVETFIKMITPKYAERIGYEPTMYVAGVGNGAGELLNFENLNL